MGLSMTKHNFCPMIKSCKSQNKTTRIFVFASIYYSTYYYFTTILCSLWQKFVYKLFNFLFRLTLRWPTRLKCQNLANVEEVSSTNRSHLTHFIQYFPGFLLLKWWVQCLACISVILGFFLCNPQDFRSFLRPYVFFWREIASYKLTSDSIDHGHRLF